MHFFNSFLLLAAFTSALARHSHHARHENHARSLERSTTTMTTTSTIFACPCHSSTTTADLSVPTSTFVEKLQTSTSTVTTITSTSTVTSTITLSYQSSSTESSTSSAELPSAPTSATTTSSTSEAQPTTTATTSNPTPTTSTSWTAIPPNNAFIRTGFGGITNSSGAGNSYTGNVGNPYGSNIARITADSASAYKYAVQFTNPSSTVQKVVIWNKIGPDGKEDGEFNHACHDFSLSPGEETYYAFDTDSQGAWAAAPGDSIPVSTWGSYAATWGEFDFGSSINGGWSGFDVSAIPAQSAGMAVQGMRICSALHPEGAVCSSVTGGSGGVVGLVHEAYTTAQAAVGGIGGKLEPGAVRLVATLGFAG